MPLLGNAHHRHRVREVLGIYGVQTVYHAAAYKHVPIVEHNVIEGIHNNVISTWYTAEAALETGVETFVLISTDKAVNPANVMGATKRLAELVLQALQSAHHAHALLHGALRQRARFVGLGGAAVHASRSAAAGPVTVTHPDVIRYFMTIPEAAQLVIQAGAMAKGGDVFVLDMGRPVRIDDLARRMISLMGLTVRDAANPEGDIEIQYTGLRTAEKLFEELLIGTQHHRHRSPDDPARHGALAALGAHAAGAERAAGRARQLRLPPRRRRCWPRRWPSTATATICATSSGRSKSLAARRRRPQGRRFRGQAPPDRSRRQGLRRSGSHLNAAAAEACSLEPRRLL